jgi:hypothetical protein
VHRLAGEEGHGLGQDLLDAGDADDGLFADVILRRVALLLNRSTTSREVTVPVRSAMARTVPTGLCRISRSEATTSVRNASRSRPNDEKSP